MNESPDVSIQVEFTWRVVGSVTLDSKQKPAFPVVPPEPGVYRFRMTGRGRAPAAYVGESYHLEKPMASKVGWIVGISRPVAQRSVGLGSEQQRQ